MISPDRARVAALALLQARSEHATLCPSEVARAITRERDGTDAAWRDAMPDVHSAIDVMVMDGLVHLSWKGDPLATRTGPYRIRHGGKGST